MKKINFLLIVCAFSCSAGFCQTKDDLLAQPTDVIARKIDNSGQITDELPSVFYYMGDGKLQKFRSPRHGLVETYTYSDDDYLVSETRSHSGQTDFTDSYHYTYENGLVKTKNHLFYDYFEDDQFWVYDYDEYGRLKQIDRALDGPNTFNYHWTYDYTDGGKTKTETYYTSFETQGVVVKKRTVSCYDDEYKLHTVETSDFNNEGDCTANTLQSYSYTSDGEVDCVVTQSRSGDGEWTNVGITGYLYDNAGRVVEIQSGTWSEEQADWDINKKTIYTHDDDAMKMTVDFYKKSNGEWIRDVFVGQPIFFGPLLRWQQASIKTYCSDILYTSYDINQFEITLQYTKSPIYLSTQEEKILSHIVYPNPVDDVLQLCFSPEVRPQCVELYDMGGRLLLQQRSNLNQLGMKELPAGVYMLRVTLDDGTIYSDKVVKQ